MKNPPREDIINPKNKFCLPCNKDFQRRQGFVEHCRNVHKMTINFNTETVTDGTSNATMSPQQRTPIATNNSGGNSLSCEYCGKQFSNRSNRNRHMLLSCEVVKNGTVTPGQSFNNTNNSSIMASPSESNDESSSGDQSPSKREPQRCPFSDCDTITERSTLMKKHLREVHGITDPTQAISSEDEMNEKKVPPLRVKLSGIGETPEPDEEAHEPTLQIEEDNYDDDDDDQSDDENGMIGMVEAVMDEDQDD